jgi:hypothetical protein
VTNRFLYPDDPEYTAGYCLWLRDPISNRRILSDETRKVLSEWCDKNCQGRYRVGMCYVDFELDSDFCLAVLHYL